MYIHSTLFFLPESSQKKKFKKTLRTAIVSLVTIAIIIWSIGLPLWLKAPRWALANDAPAITESAIIATSTVRASVNNAVLGAFTVDNQHAGEQNLTTITLVNNTGKTATGTDIASLSIFSDSGAIGVIDGADLATSTITDANVLQSFGAGGSGVVFTLNNPVTLGVAGSATSSLNFIVAVNTAAGVIEGRTFQVKFNATVGGTAGTALAATKTVTVDTIPPRITVINYINPSTFDIVFSEVMGTTTAIAATSSYYMFINGVRQNIGTSTFQSDSRTVRLTPENTQALSDRDSLMVSSTVTDMAGNTLSDPGRLMPTFAGSNVVLSEIQVTGGTATDEFVELYNRSGSSIDISGWKIAKANSAGATSTLLTVPGSTSIAANSYYLYGHEDYDGTPAANETSTGVTLGADESVLLYDNNNNLKNMVGWGNATLFHSPVITNFDVTAPHESIERSAVSTSTEATMTSGGAHAGLGNGFDNKHNSFSWNIKTTSDPQSSVSAAEPSGLSAYNESPNIWHESIWKAVADTNLIFYANIFDMETLPADLTVSAYASSTGTSYSYQAISGEYLGYGMYRFVIPYNYVTSTISAGLDYYLVANDGTASTNFGTSGAPMNINLFTSSHNRSISGTITDSSGNAIAGALVFLGGTGNWAISGTNGAYSISNLFDGCYSIKVFAAGFMDADIPGGPCVNSSTPSAVNWNMSLSSDTGGGGSGGENPWVMWSAPSPYMMSSPSNISLETHTPILIAFNREMSSSTINATNILLKKVNFDGSLISVAVSVAYEPQNSSVTIGNTVYEHGNDPVAIIYSSTLLETDAQYKLELLPNIIDTNGNSLTGTRPGGGEEIYFGTSSGYYTSGQITTTNFGSGGGFMPPYINSTSPAPGSFNVAQNAKLVVSFSEAMDSTSINSTNIKFFNADTNAELAATLSLDTSNKVLIMTPSASLSNGVNYSIKVYGGARSSSGITMAPPGSENNMIFESRFSAGSTSDTTAPTGTGVNLEMYRTDFTCAVTSSGCLMEIPVNEGIIEVGFSEDLDPSTINSTNVYLTKTNSTTKISGTVKYNISSRMVRFMSSSAFSANTNYTFTITTAVTDLVGNALAANYAPVFQTQNFVDTTRPGISFINADNTKLAISFEEPMNSVLAGAANYASSTLNPANYTLKTASGPPPATEVDYNNGGTLADDTGLTINYDAFSRTIIISGLSLPTNSNIRVYLNGVTDLSGNVIRDNTNTSPGPYGNFGCAPVLDASMTFGMIGPGTEGMMGPPPTSNMQSGTMAITDFGGKDPGMMGMMPIGVWPDSMLAGAVTRYMIDMPIATAIPASTATASSSIVLTFPSGFDISNAKSGDPNNYYWGQDMNGPGAGTVTISNWASDNSGGLNNDGIIVNTSARTVTVLLGTTGIGANDFIHFEIDGIKNSLTATDYNTSGYTVDIKTKGPNGNILESMTSMPFFLSQPGKFTLRGQFSVANGTTKISGVEIYGGGPIGPIATTTISKDFGSGAEEGRYEIVGLAPGDYMIMTDPIITPVGSSTDYFGITPLSISVREGDANVTDTSGGACDPSDTLCYYTKNITLSSTAIGTALTVNVIGDFSGGSEQIDVFAHSYAGFSVRTVTANSDYSSTSPLAVNLYLPADGDYMVGMGPAMPKGPGMMMAPPMPNWMPPPMIGISYDTTRGWSDPAGATIGDAVNDGAITLSISATNKTITGYVKDGAGNAISNAEVYAYSPNVGFGTHNVSKNDGSFTLNVIEGSYKVGAFMMGMPPSQEVSVEIKGSTMYQNGAEVTSITIKIAKGGYTISGKVTDGTYPVTNAGVYAYRTDGPGHAGTMTDTMGKYIIYVTDGNWNVGAFLPGFGELTEKNVTISGANYANLNFSPTSGVTTYTISGRVYQDNVVDNNSYDSGEELGNVYIQAYGAAGKNMAITSTADGAYTMTVPAGTYTVEAFSHTYGELPVKTADASAGNVTNVDFKMEAPRTVTINFTDSNDNPLIIDNALIDLDHSTSTESNNIVIKSATSTTISIFDGEFNLDPSIPGVSDSQLTISTSSGTVYNTSSKVLTIDGNETITVKLPALYTVSGTVYHTAAQGGNELTDAWVELIDASNGIHFGAMSTSSNYTFKVPNGTYHLLASKPGYIGAPSATGPRTLIVSGGNATANVVLEAAAYTVSGTVYTGTSVATNKAFVRAVKLGGGFVGVEADSAGVYSMKLSAGDWRIFGMAEGFSEVAYANNPVNISANTAGLNITLAATPNITLQAPKTQSVVALSGGVVEDTNAGLKVVIPPGALGSGSKTYQVQIKETNIIPTPSSVPLNNKAANVSIADSNGLPLSILQSDILIEQTISKADLTSAGITSLVSADKVTPLATYDVSAQAYETAEFSSVAHNLVDVNGADDWSNLSSVTYKGYVDHLTVFNPTAEQDGLNPAAPGQPAVAAGSSGNNISWDAVTTNADGTAISDLLGYEIYRSTSAGGTFTQINTSDLTTTNYYDTGATADTTYYYKVTAADTGGNESAMSAVSSGISWTTGGGGGGGGGGGIPVSTVTPTPTTTTEETAAAEEITTTPTITAGLPAAAVTAGLSQGNLIRMAGDYKVYVIKDGYKRWIQDSKIFDFYGHLNWAAIKEVSSQVANSFTSSWLVRADGDYKVYEINGDKSKHWLDMTAAQFESSGRQWGMIDVINKTELNFYTTGPTVLFQSMAGLLNKIALAGQTLLSWMGL